jgi:YegS/Rv2252/BmrU family lipid kinase
LSIQTGPSAITPTWQPVPRTATLIVNTRARRGAEWFAQARDCLKASGVRIEAAHALEEPERLPHMVGASVDSGAKLVVVGGGDGSFRCVAGILAGTDTVLGVLPLGTVNDFARNLGIEPNVEEACSVIAAGNVARVDLGQANEDYYLITASLGFSSITQQLLVPRLKKALGPCGYVAASILAWRRLRRFEITVESEQAAERMTILQAGVVNGHSWMGGQFEIPGMDLESGRLAFYAVPPQASPDYWRIARCIRQGRFFQTPGLRAFTTRDITIRTAKPQPLVLDGDLCGQTPVRLRIVPDALQVCVPPDFNKTLCGCRSSLADQRLPSSTSRAKMDARANQIHARRSSATLVARADQE